MTCSILLVDHDLTAASQVQAQLQKRKFHVDLVSTYSKALSAVQDMRYLAIVIDNAENSEAALDLLKTVSENHYCPVSILVSNNNSIGNAVQAMRFGASDVFTKPLDIGQLSKAILPTKRSTVTHAKHPSTSENSLHDEAFQAWRDDFASDMIGEHPSILSVLQSIRRISQTDCDVLITGASGTGKELIARCIHLASHRRKKPFVALNCAAIPKELMESEIYGHTRGAFTGATEKRAGKFEIAHSGSLLLDEIGEMDVSLQSKLLRVLQEREITPIGDSRVLKVDVRIIAATNQNLRQLCDDKIFRDDLYYRLNVVPVHLPTLAQRRSDIPLLAAHFIRKANHRHGRNIRGIDAHAASSLCAYGWPGNIRELHNIIERIAVLKPDDTLIGVHDLPSHIHSQKITTTNFLGQPIALPKEGLDINETLACMEERLTIEALERSHGNKARAAELLGLKRTTLVERLKKLNLSELVQ